ncbi:MAG: helix-turn-helix domain-containing protein [Desulfomonilaceae bacterium]
MRRSLVREDNAMDDNGFFLLSTYSYVKERQMLRESLSVSPQPEMPCAQQIGALVESVRDLVSSISSNTSSTRATPETFGVCEAAEKMGCSPQQVRVLVHESKLKHHWLGKNLRFRQKDLEDFWDSQTRREADKTSSRKLSEGRDRKGSDTKASSLPTRREVDKLWR